MAILAGLLSLLLIPPMAVSAPKSACPALFGKALGTSSDANLTQLSSLNDNSREYLSRLRYLIKERRLLGPEVYQLVSNSPTPINPLGDHPSSVVFLPHFEAFASLMKSNLQWEQIRNAARTTAGLVSAERVREQAAVKETTMVLLPMKIKDFPFRTERVVQTAQGKLLAIEVRAEDTQGSSDIIAYDIPSGTPMAKVTVDAILDPDKVDVKVQGNKVLVTDPVERSRQLFTVDMTKKEIISFPVLGQGRMVPSSFFSLFGAHSPEPFIQASYFVDNNGKLEVVTFINNQAIFVDPMTGMPRQQITFNDDAKALVWGSGPVANMIFVTDTKDRSTLLNSSQSQPYYGGSDFLFIKSFSYKGKTYALGRDLKVTPSDREHIVIRSLDIAAGQPLEPIEVLQRDGWPTLLDVFEQEGNLYGVLSADGDTYAADLINGKIINQESTVAQSKQIKLNFRETIESENPMGFDYQGRRYLVVVGREGPEEKTHLYVVDALTLKVTAAGMPLEKGVYSIHILPGDDDKPRAVVNFNDGTSQLVSLANRF